MRLYTSGEQLCGFWRR